MIKFKNKGAFEVAPDKQFMAWIKKTLPDYPTIFDYGCGYGGWTNLISSLKYSQVDVDDVDERALFHRVSRPKATPRATWIYT